MLKKVLSSLFLFAFVLVFSNVQTAIAATSSKTTIKTPSSVLSDYAKKVEKKESELTKKQQEQAKSAEKAKKERLKKIEEQQKAAEKAKKEREKKIQAQKKEAQKRQEERQKNLNNIKNNANSLKDSFKLK